MKILKNEDAKVIANAPFSALLDGDIFYLQQGAIVIDCHFVELESGEAYFIASQYKHKKEADFCNFSYAREADIEQSSYELIEVYALEATSDYEQNKREYSKFISELISQFTTLQDC